MTPAQLLRRGIARLLAPGSIAIVGTSPAGGRGRSVQRNVQRFGYPGRLYAVNPKYDEVLGVACYPSLSALPETVDCAVVALPAEPATRIVEEAASRGVGGVVVLASGFAEMGEAGVERQQQLREVARAAGLAVCGPNCAGFLSMAARAVALSSPVTAPLKAGTVAIVSQSGGLSLELAGGLLERGVGLANVVSTGNEAATTFEEYLDVLLDEPGVRVVAAVVEEFKQPLLFLEVAERAAMLGKPIVVLKLGRSAHGQRAVASHTGALAGDDRIVDAVFHRWGVIRATSVDQLVEIVVLLSRHRALDGQGVAFVSGSGGRSALMADLAADAGVPLAEYAPATRRALADLLPNFGSINNPLDLTGALYDQEGLYATALGILTRDPNVGLLAIYQNARSVPAGGSPERSSLNHKLARTVAAVAQHTRKPMTTFSTISGGSLDSEVAAVLEQSGVALLQGPESAVRAIGAAVRYGAFVARRRSSATPAASGAVSGLVAQLKDALARSGALSEHRGKQLLAEYGIPTTREALATSVGEAERIAEGLGYPVVLKACSPRIVHKTEAGLVRLGVRDSRELRASFDDLQRRAAAHLGPEQAALEGVLVQELARPGVEVIVGARNSRFGPVVMFGAGGILAELLQDTSIRLCPVDEAEAREMVAETRISSILDGARGQAPSDLAALAAAIAGVARLAFDLRDVLSELDLNPILVYPRGEGILALDAVVRSSGRGEPWAL